MASESVTLLNDKRIVLGVTGSIAVYKAVDLASKLTQAGALVDVVMTASAKRFVTPLTFQSVTGRPVYDDMWTSGSSELPTHIAHVGLGEGSDLFVIAPATANTLAKLAAGAADDLLTVTALAARCPVLIAPAMDGGMYGHPATQRNLRDLQAQGVFLIEPEEGRFASGLVGKGRLPETATLLGMIRWTLSRNGPLAGRKVVVTAGGTREAIDPVRYITNRSSGKQGYAVAQAAVDAGSDVVLVTTTVGLPAPIGATMVPVASAGDMLDSVQAHIANADVLIMAAAVADFRPAEIATQKIKKSLASDDVPTIELSRTADILLAIKEQREGSGWPRVTVGFAAESHDLLDNARSKLDRKGLDLIVANDIMSTDAGFETDTNRVVLLDRSGDQQEIDLASKARIAEAVVGRVVELLSNSAPQ
ncbi:MAG: bifunctional phosphopantothenoylcysteine decarboxylase/phosphopantothenate--cysteine ligase CoaBC [Chloroflexia bacterium]|nr:bifunctional phosphopantothenoylcysteine decarboxylase/phosphopantothenate--cysteine ligase CoaBC [Chloroflexia bacterium]